MPGIGIGLWPQSETPLIGLYFCGVLSSTGIFLIAAGSENQRWQNRIDRIIKNPLVFLPLVLGAISIILLPLHSIPMRSFLGAIQSGEGGLWWINLGILTASGLLIWSIRNFRRAILCGAYLSFFICFVLALLFKHAHFPYAPLYFSDYLSFHIFCLIPVTLLLWSKYRPKNIRKSVGFLILYCVLNTLLFLVDNRTMLGIGLILPALYFWGLVFFKQKKQPLDIKFLMPLMALPVAVIIFYLGLAFAYQEQGFYSFIGTGGFRTIASRAYLVGVSFESLIQKPSALIYGYGWGSFADHLTQFQPTQWIDFRKVGWSQWDGLMRDHFHSHNMFIETLNSIGFLGALILALYFISFFTHSSNKMRVPAFLLSFSFMAWASLWFLMPIHHIFLVFAAVTTSRFKQSGYFKKTNFSNGFLYTGLIIVALLQIFAATVIYKTAKNTTQFKADELSAKEASEKCPYLYHDYASGGMHLSRLMLDTIRPALDPADSVPIDSSIRDIDKSIRKTNHLFCQSQEYIRTQVSSQRLIIADLLTRGEVLLSLNETLDKDTRNLYYDGWAKALANWLKKNPKRSDIAVPYLLYNLINNQEYLSKPVVNIIYDQNPDDPLGLWFRGISILKENPTSKEAIQSMKKALDKGIERFLPVDTTTKNMLLSYR